MADEEKPAVEQPVKVARKLPLMTIGLISGVALLQAGGFFLFIKMFYSTPAPTYAQGQNTGANVTGHGNAAGGGEHGKPADAAKSADHGAAKPEAKAGGEHGGGPGEAGGDAAAAPLGKYAEVDLVKKLKVPNNGRGVAYIYDFDIAMVVLSDLRNHASTLVSQNQAQVQDRIAQIVRAAPSRVLDEPDFRSLRLQIRDAVQEIFDDHELILQILIPRCVPIRTE